MTVEEPGWDTEQGAKIGEEAGSGSERILQDRLKRARVQKTSHDRGNQRKRDLSEEKRPGRRWECGPTRHFRHR